MKSMMIGMLLALGCVAEAGLPDGNFSGVGLWKSSDGKTGTYTATASVANGQVSADYKLPDGSDKSWTFQMVDTSNGFFSVQVAGKLMGSGYCIDKASLCHYTLDGAGSLEETLTIVDDRLYRVGSKIDGNGDQIFWQESLQKN